MAEDVALESILNYLGVPQAKEHSHLRSGKGTADALPLEEASPAHTWTSVW